MSAPDQTHREFQQRSGIAMPDWTRSPPTPPTIDLTGPPEPPRARAPLTLPTRSVEIIEIDSNDEDSDIGGSRHSNNNYISSGDDGTSDGDDVLFVRENPAQAGPSSLHEYFNWRRVPVMPRPPRPQLTEANEYMPIGRERGNVFGSHSNNTVGGPSHVNRNHGHDQATARNGSAREAADSSHSLDAQIAAAIASGGRVQHHHHHHHHVVRPHPYNNPAPGAPQQQHQQQPRRRQRQRRGPLQVLDEAILDMLGMVGVGQMSAFDQFVRARDERRIRQRSMSIFRDDPTEEIDFYRLHQEMEDRAQAVAAEARAAAAASRTPEVTNDELDPGVTKALTLDTVVICPTCRLPFGHSGVETAELWVIWGCGHVICGDCVDGLFITKTEIKSTQESPSKASPSKNGRGKGRAKNKASAKSTGEDDGGADVDISERDPATKEDPEAERLFKITKKQYGNCPCCNRKVKRSSIVRLYH